MIQTGFESKVKIQQIIDNQLPDFVRSESPTTIDFLKQYYISQEYQGGPVDISDNLSEYLKLDNLTPEVVVDSATTTGITTIGDTVINVSSTKGFPNEYGLLKIDDEIITYTSLNAEKNKFVGCVRGFCGITSYHKELNQEELVFNNTTAASHSANSNIQNLSSLFLKQFYEKQKYTLTPDLVGVDFAPDVNIGNFIKESRSLYEAKGTDESFRILFNVLYGETPKVVNLEDYLLKPSSAEYIRREVIIGDAISGDPSQLVGQTIFKENDLDTNASISEVEPFTRSGVGFAENKQYWKISLFMGYDKSASTIQGKFKITPASKCLENVSIGSSIISVDSTIGFGNTGTLVAGNNTNINYTSKSINQFFGCTGIDDLITSTETVRNDDIYVSYENADLTKPVKIRLTGVLSNFEQISKNLNVDKDQIISVNGIGDIIEEKKNISNSEDVSYSDMSYKEIFANSWVYNTSVRFKPKSIGDVGSASTVTKAILFEKIYDSSLKRGDKIEILERGTNNIKDGLSNDIIITTFDPTNNQLDFNNATLIPQSGVEYDIRRKVSHPKSTIVSLKYDNIISDVQNLYIGDDKVAYVASNSLPSQSTDSGNSNNDRNNITSNIQVATAASLDDKNVITGKYGLIKFPNEFDFIDGDEVFYQPISPYENYVGLATGNYYVNVILDEENKKKQLRLYNSRSFIGDANYLQFGNLAQSTETDIHKFILLSQKSAVVSPQKIFKKFSLESTVNRGVQEKTTTGSVGLLKNGVEISNYKTLDKIYYGSLSSIDILNGGSDYDVINPPLIGISSGIGITALIQPVLSGTITKVEVDEQQFDVNKVISVNVSGGNGAASLEAVTIQKSRSLIFDGRRTSDSNVGGINTITDEVTFTENHGFQNGQTIIYKSSNKNQGIGIGSTPGMLINNAIYYAGVSNNKSIKLYNSENNAIVGINTIGLGTHATTVVSTAIFSGIHEFITLPNQTSVSGINIIDGGEFTNRKIIVKPSGISTNYNTVTFDNHGFNDGEIIEYTTTGTKISGLTTSTGITTTANQYKISKIDENSFKLCDIGIAGTITSNYIRKNYVNFESTGTGYQNFAYPNINVTLNYVPAGLSTDTQVIETMNLTTTVKGSIIDSYLYESGTGYGSSIVNFEKSPIISIKNGKDGQLKPLIVDGKIDSVNLQFGGSEYYSIPDINVIDSSGKGSGAVLRPVITNNKITDVKIINAGIGYSSIDTSINVVSKGKNALLRGRVRSLTVNMHEKYGSEVLLDGFDGLKYNICGYNQNIQNAFDENETEISNIIGWAYDGNPIYGPYGYANPEIALTPSRMVSGYTKNASNVVDRPSTDDFPLGFFVEDYKFTNSGNLDRNNGRFSKTKEFPNGIYAYYATIDSTSKPEFPYFVGDSYRSLVLEQDIDQSFDFSDKNLIRNTFPYRLSDKNTDNDFIIETNEITRQKSVVETITKGKIDQISIISGGDNYKINDSLKFDNINTNGSGLVSKVSSLKGKDIVDITTSLNSFENSIFSWNGNEGIKITILPHHNFKNGDNITISGFTTHLTELNGSHKIGVTTFSSILIGSLESSTVGVGTEITVSKIPTNISIGSSLKIGNETLRLLGVYRDNNILKVERGSTGVAHTSTSILSFLPDSFTIDKKIDYFDSSVNDIVYFNPKESIGFGTISGISSTMTFDFNNKDITVNVPTQRIYIQNHPFIENQQISLLNNDPNDIKYNEDPSNPANGNINLPSTLFVSNTSKNTIGIKTGVGIGYSDVYFVSGGDDVDVFRLSSNYDQLLGNIQKNVATVSVSTSHSLVKGDNVTLNVKPNLSVGIGTSSSVVIEKQEGTNYMLINPIGFSSTGINTDKNEISFGTISHELNTGDKIVYSADLFPEGISASSYYVYKVNDNIIKLCETLVDIESHPPTTISIGSTGGIDQSIRLINPPLKVITTNSLVFDLSHSSLADYKFKIYYDKEFKNEFVSTSSTIFNVVNTGIIGVSGDASVTINHNTSLPTKLYYNLEKSGFINTADTSVTDYSRIDFTQSNYNSSYNIVSVGDTTFDILLTEIPEKLSYNQSECSTLNYTTKSLTEKGSVDKVTLLDKGQNYEKLPTLVGTSSTEGVNLTILPKSSAIGNPLQVRIINEGFEYSSDKTLKPFAYISPFINIKNSNQIGIVTLTSGGSDYITPPIIKIIDSVSRTVIDNGILEAEMNGSTISNIVQTVTPYGLPDTGIELFATDNSNGVAISTISSNSTGIFTCYIQTPVSDFTILPFKVDDEVYIEGITKVGIAGSGFNSSDLGYKFGVVTQYTVAAAGSNDSVTIDVSGIVTNTGIAVTDQNLESILVNKSKYPIFTISLETSLFLIGEKLISNGIERDLVITHSEKTNIKVSGTYRLSVGEEIIGKSSGVKARIDNIDENFGRYSVNYMIEKNIGWSNNVGELNFDTQVTPDNNYYQNLSYAIQSSKTFDELRSPVNSLLHTSGMKNFADVGIKSESNVSIGSSSALLRIQDFIRDLRVDTINNFDFAFDLGDDNKSNSIEFYSKKLTPYTLSKSNQVLLIDNIKNQFTNVDGDPSLSLDFIRVDSNISCKELSIRISDLVNNKIQSSQLVLLNNGTTSVLLQKDELDTTTGLTTFSGIGEIGYFDLVETEFGEDYLRFIPYNPDIDYDLKTIETDFIGNTGIGTQSVGFTSLTSSIGISTVDSDLGITTTTIIGVDSNKYESFYAKTQLINRTTNEMNYVEHYVTHDSTDTYLTESFIDTHSQRDSYSGQLIGTFKGDLTDTQFSLLFENTSDDEIEVKSNIVGFGTTTAGTGTYRFLVDNQPAGSERSLIYASNYNTGIGTTVVYSGSKILFNTFMSVVEVSIGSTKALHQVTSLYDGTNVYVQQGPILSSDGYGTYSEYGGIGTFSGTTDSTDFILNFHPDEEFLDDTIQVSSFNKVFYIDTDTINTPNIVDLIYGGVINSPKIYAYDGLEGERIRRKNFRLTSNQTPIFAKSFNPIDSSIVNLSTGVFTIKDHFFRTNEELIYTPKSTFVGVGSTPMQYKGADGGIGQLPTNVFAIRNTSDSFQIATTRAGTAVTFVGVGTGNAHQFEMSKSNTKAIININNLIQSPLAFTPINHTLKDNIDDANTGISTTRDIISLSGISSVIGGDILKVDDEYMKVINVGFGNTSIGPITGIGTTTLVEVKRGFVGTSATNHTNSSNVQVYKGSYNIVGEEIHFTDAPRGNPQLIKNSSNLNYPTSDFNGRVFLRNDYSTNQIYDDISDQFTGIGQTFTLQVGGANTVGLGSTGGNGLILIGNIFQRPTTENNPRNNYAISEDINAGVSTVTFTGITSTQSDDLIINDSDVNQNQLPIGGVIVSLASTPGKGYALAEGAKVYLEKNASGGITKVVGFATTGPSNGVTTAFYDNTTGFLEVITENQHNFESGIGQQVKLHRLEFKCSGSYGITTTFFPSNNNVGLGSTSLEYSILNTSPGYYDHKFISATATAVGGIQPTGADYNAATGELTFTKNYHSFNLNQSIAITDNSLTFTCSRDNYNTEHTYPRPGKDPVAVGGGSTTITSVTQHTFTVNVGQSQTQNRFTTNVGTSTIPHTYVGGGDVMPWYGDATYGSGYYGTNVSVAVTDIPYAHKFVSAVTDSITQGGTTLTPSNAVYNAVTGILVLSFTSAHGLSGGNIKIATNGLTFTCDKDDNQSYHSYPRSTDPAYDTDLAITVIDTLSFSVDVGSSVGSSAVVAATVGAGGTLAFETTTAGTNYNNPQLVIPEASYGGLGVVGVSRLGEGETTNTGVGLLLDIEVGGLPIDSMKHTFVSADPGAVERISPSLAAIQPSGATYNASTGVLELSFGSAHGLITDNTIRLVNNSLTFTCDADENLTEHTYPRATDPIAGVTTAITKTGTNSFTINVGKTSFTGISSFFGVTKWEIARNGYAFKKGDVFKPVGLVTDSRVASPQAEFELTVLDTFSDSFAAWQFGQMDYIDSIKDQQDGVRRRFQLKYDGQILSFETDPNSDFPRINLTNTLFILINGIIQEPGSAYTFTGGTSFTFTVAPKPEDNVVIFFYRGSVGSDSSLVENIQPSVKTGDIVQLDAIQSSDIDQNTRTVQDIITSKSIETNLYRGVGINDNQKTLNWTKQKVDKIINGEKVFKSRASLEPMIFPTAKVIGKISDTTTKFFVDEALFFNEEYDIDANKLSAIIVDNNITPVGASLTAIVSAAGTISSLDIVSGGIGYTVAPSIAIGIPTTGILDKDSEGNIIGIGTTALATSTIDSNGTITSTLITNPGLGYTLTTPPQVLVLSPLVNSEIITNIGVATGISGIVTGINTTTGNGTALALEFHLYKDPVDNYKYSDLAINYPIYISNTQVGNGVTSIYDSNTAVVGIGTTFLDNVYNISYAPWSSGNVGLITCNVIDDSVLVGITSTGSSSVAVGRFSLGILDGATRNSNPIAIAVTGKTTNSGLTTFPTIQRRGVGYRDTGALDPFYS